MTYQPGQYIRFTRKQQYTKNPQPTTYYGKILKCHRGFDALISIALREDF